MSQHESFVWKFFGAVGWACCILSIITMNPLFLIIGGGACIAVNWIVRGMNASQGSGVSETIRTYDEAADAALESEIKRRRNRRRRQQQRDEN